MHSGLLDELPSLGEESHREVLPSYFGLLVHRCLDVRCGGYLLMLCRFDLVEMVKDGPLDLRTCSFFYHPGLEGFEFRVPSVNGGRVSTLYDMVVVFRVATSRAVIICVEFPSLQILAGGAVV